MSDFKRLAHAVWECKYHLVWCPKYRFRILKGEIGKSVGEIVKQLCGWKKSEEEILGASFLGKRVLCKYNKVWMRTRYVSMCDGNWRKINKWSNLNFGKNK